MTHDERGSRGWMGHRELKTKRKRKTTKWEWKVCQREQRPRQYQTFKLRASLQLCRSSSGLRVLELWRGHCWSPHASRRWCRRSPPPPPHASRMSLPLIHCPHTGNTEERVLRNMFTAQTNPLVGLMLSKGQNEEGLHDSKCCISKIQKQPKLIVDSFGEIWPYWPYMTMFKEIT